MNIRPMAGNSVPRQIRASPNLGPFRKSLFLAVGMFVPASDRRGLGSAKEHLSYAYRRASPRRHRRCGCRL